MPFEVFILGNNSAIPAHGRHPTSQVVQIKEQLFLVDCGEGTQMQLAKYKIRKSKFNHIFISHLHGDHYFGLIGLITSYHLMRRPQPLHIYGPAQLLDIINLQLAVSNTTLAYELIFHTVTVDGETVLFEDEDLIISSFPVIHRIPTVGFLFKEKSGLRKFKAEKVSELDFPFQVIAELKKGNDVEWEGKKLIADEWTLPPAIPRSYAFCADTIYHEELKKYISGCDLIYHEATFMEESTERAVITFHSTARQAATMAKIIGVKKLLIGHFSAKYDDLQPLLAEAKEIFPETELAIEGLQFSIERQLQ